MSKTIKGYKLIKALEEGKLRAGQQVKFTSTIAPETKIAIVITKEEGLYLQDTDTKNVINTGWLINSKIEIIEEQQDIDIQKIEEFKIKGGNGEIEYFEYDNHGATESGYSKNYSLDDIECRKLINKLVQAVKQLDKNIKDKE